MSTITPDIDSLEYAKEMLKTWMECEQAIATGQTKAYKIGSMEYTALDLDQIQNRVIYWKNRVEVLSGTAKKSGVHRVVFRDL